jgi:hypothetical protein
MVLGILQLITPIHITTLIVIMIPITIQVILLIVIQALQMVAIGQMDIKFATSQQNNHKKSRQNLDFCIVIYKI